MPWSIDTSIFLRLLTGDPDLEYRRVLRRPLDLIEGDPATEVVVSNQVIGEAYVALRHHYGVSKADARSALLSVFESGLLSPCNGMRVLDHIRARSGCGLLDRLIHDGYASAGTTTLTLDRRMARLDGTRRL